MLLFLLAVARTSVSSLGTPRFQPQTPLSPSQSGSDTSRPAEESRRNHQGLPLMDTAPPGMLSLWTSLKLVTGDLQDTAVMWAGFCAHDCPWGTLPLLGIHYTRCLGHAHLSHGTHGCLVHTPMSPHTRVLYVYTPGSAHACISTQMGQHAHRSTHTCIGTRVSTHRCLECVHT